MSKEPLPRPSPDVVYRELHDEVVLVHLRTNRIFSLNSTGARFWQLLDEGSDRARIRDQLLSEFDVDDESLEAEMAQLLSSLSAEGLVR